MEWLRNWRPIDEALVMASCLSMHPFAIGAASAQQAKPNIMFILDDNIGYGDIGATAAGVARIANAAYRPARLRLTAVDAVFGRALLHILARRLDRAAATPTTDSTFRDGAP